MNPDQERNQHQLVAQEAYDRIIRIKLITIFFTDGIEVAVANPLGCNQFDPDDPIISFLSDQLVLVSFLVWIHE